MTCTLLFKNAECLPAGNQQLTRWELLALTWISTLGPLFGLKDNCAFSVLRRASADFDFIEDLAIDTDSVTRTNSVRTASSHNREQLSLTAGTASRRQGSKLTFDAGAAIADIKVNANEGKKPTLGHYVVSSWFDL
jgi:hypothetical protein